jgi:hypothetical protein
MFPSVARSATDNPRRAQQLGDRQDEVGRGCAFAQGSAQPEADHLRDEHRQRLADHGCLRLDAADTPAEHTDAVDHRRVRVGSDERVRKREAVAILDDAREVLQVDLMADSGARRHDLEVVERDLPPAQELVALPVALELELDVAGEGDA